MKTRVLCTFAATYDGGILRVMKDGLPHLNRQPGIDLSVGDLYEREDIKKGFRDAGLAVSGVGVRCPPYISVRLGVSRQLDKLRSALPHWQIALRLRDASRKADVLYVHTYKELALAMGSHARIVWHCHGLDEIPPFTAHLARRCDHVIAISETVAGVLRGIGIPNDRISTVFNAVNLKHILAPTDLAAPLPERSRTPVVLLPASSIRKVKGTHALLEAARLVQPLDIWVTGNMDDPAAVEYATLLRELSRSSQLAGRVHFLGHRPDIYAVMRAADIVCVPSMYREGFGLVAAEAMALGKPVVVSNRGALPELVAHGQNGIVVDPDAPEEFSAALRTLISDPGYAAMLGREGSISVKIRCSYERWARDVATILEGRLEEKTGNLQIS